MRAAAITGDGHLALVDKPEPVPGPDEVVLAVERCGVCGSDLHARAGGLLPAGAVLGHEIAGTIVARGPAVGAPGEGDRVAVLPARRCGVCAACRSGRDNLCPAQLTTAIGLGMHDGGYAERVVVPASSCHPLPSTVTPDQGAMVEPYAVGLHAVARSRVAHDPSSPVGVVGAGSVGLMCVAALKRAGVTSVGVAEPRPRRAAAAAALGAIVVDRATALVGALGAPPHVAFDTTGDPAAPAACLEVVAPGGQVVLLGVVGPGVQVSLPGLLWVVKEVDVTPSIAYTTEEFAEAVVAVADGAVDGVDHEVRPLGDADRALDDLSRRDGPVKVLLAPDM